MSSSSGRGGRRHFRVPDPLPTPVSDPPDDGDDADASGRGDRFVTPPTPMLVLRPDATPSPYSPDTEANVARQTTGLFGTFVLELDGRQQASSDSSPVCLRESVEPVDSSVHSTGSGTAVDNAVSLSAAFVNNGLLPITTQQGSTLAVPDELLTLVNSVY